jgi:hypothetical protein
MSLKSPCEFPGRMQRHAREWGVIIEDTFETESSVSIFGARDVIGMQSHELSLWAGCYGSGSETNIA